jgi:hypothetical protein
VNRALLPLLLALPLACRGTFDLDKYVTDGESGTMTSATSIDETATTIASETRADETTSTDTHDATATTDTTDTETETTDTDEQCSPPNFEIGVECIGLRQVFETNKSPVDMEVADFSNDGFLDLLLPGAPVGYHGGLPDGMFDGVIDVIGINAARLASIDWNNDVLPDILVISAQNFQFFVTDGAGGFINGPSYAPGGHEAAFGEFNDDNIVDVFVSGPTVRGFQGDNDGVLMPPAIDLAYSAEAIVAADLNGDDDGDLLFAMPSMGQVGVILREGPWQFPNPLVWPLPQVADVAAADIDGIAGMEILAVGNQGADGVLFLGRIDAGMISGSVYTVGGGPRALSIGEIAGDSAVDVAVANFGTHDVSVLLGGDGGLTNEFRLPVESVEDFPESIVVADIEGDGTAEIIVGMINSERVLVYGTPSP